MSQDHVTDEQIERMVIVIDALAKRGNAAAIGIAKSLYGKPLQAQRVLVLGFFGVLFEALSCMQMALDSTRPIDEILMALGQKK